MTCVLLLSLLYEVGHCGTEGLRGILKVRLSGTLLCVARQVKWHDRMKTASLNCCSVCFTQGWIKFTRSVFSGLGTAAGQRHWASRKSCLDLGDYIGRCWQPVWYVGPGLSIALGQPRSHSLSDFRAAASWKPPEGSWLTPGHDHMQLGYQQSPCGSLLTTAIISRAWALTGAQDSRQLGRGRDTWGPSGVERIGVSGRLS